MDQTLLQQALLHLQSAVNSLGEVLELSASVAAQSGQFCPIGQIRIEAVRIRSTLARLERPLSSYHLWVQLDAIATELLLHIENSTEPQRQLLINAHRAVVAANGKLLANQEYSQTI
ncbi:hypothetical protein JNK13_00720 [bacterium]|nr:hypothetical protein [bacterium]